MNMIKLYGKPIRVNKVLPLLAALLCFFSFLEFHLDDFSRFALD
jgi:hypothetical protein